MVAASRFLMRRAIHALLPESQRVLGPHGRQSEAVRTRRAGEETQRDGSFEAIFARGGTSNGLVVVGPMPPPHALASAMGSPDPYGRQLDGMGSGLSSTSKICVLAPSNHADADVDFTFVQIGVKDGSLDMAGNCGNMSSVIGPVSLNEGLLGRAPVVERDPSTGYQTTLARILNTNTGKIIHSRFRVTGHPPVYCPSGDYEMDGVPGKQSKIVLSFINPAGAKTGQALPTGKPIDMLTLPGGETIEASLVDVSNPGVFVRVSDLGLGDIESLDPARIEGDASLKSRLEQIRRAGASMMGLDPDVQSVPKVVLVFPRPPTKRLPGKGLDIKCLALSMGQAHKAVPLTLALCLGAATRMPGTIPHQLSALSGDGEAVTIGHPSGSLQVGTTVKDGQILSAELHRTARILMKGRVFYRNNNRQEEEGGRAVDP